MLERLRLADGTVWPLPFTLAVDDATRRRPARRQRGRAGRRLRPRLGRDPRRETSSTRDPLEESRAVYGTEDATHPGVAYLLGRPRSLVGGTVRVLPLPDDLPFARYRLTPRALRAEIAGPGMAARGRLPDPQPHPPRARAPHEGRPGGDGRPRPASPGRRDQGRRRPRLRALPRVRSAGGGLLPEGPHDPGRLPRRHALRRPARGALPRAGAEELRHHASARRPRPRRRRQVLRAVRRPRDLRPLHDRGAGRDPDQARHRVLLPRLRKPRLHPHLPARRRRPARAVGHARARDPAQRRRPAARVHAQRGGGGAARSLRERRRRTPAAAIANVRAPSASPSRPSRSVSCLPEALRPPRRRRRRGPGRGEQGQEPSRRRRAGDGGGAGDPARAGA